MYWFTLEQLATLRALTDEGTFEAAARRLRVTSSAISQRVKAMEQAAGRVLVRRGLPVTLTAAGDVVLRYARQVELLESDTLRELDEDAAGGERSLVPLAVNADSLATWFLGSLAGLGERLGVSFDLHREDQAHTATLLRSGAVMAAVTSTRSPVQGCVTEPLGLMRYRAVATPAFRDRWLPEHPRLGALAVAPVVVFDRSDELQRDFVRDRAGATRGSAPAHFVPASNDFARAVAIGLGWGMLPEQQCLALIDAGTLVELAPEHPVDIALYWQRWNLASPLLDAVSAAVLAAAASSLHPFPVARPARL